MSPAVEGTVLRTLFLFGDLPDDQLAWLAARVERRVYPDAATVFREGQPADHLFVLLEGSIRRLRRAGRDDVLLTESSRPGVFAGAVRPFVGPAGATYDSTLLTTSRTSFVCLSAADFTTYVRTYLPMAVHLVGGTFTAVHDSEATLREREYVARLGALSAGLAHELNNPASALGRAGGQLRQSLADGLGQLQALAGTGISADRLRRALALPDQVGPGGRPSSAARSPLDRAAAEDRLLTCLEHLGVAHAEDLAEVFAMAEVDPAWLASTAELLPKPERGAVLRWLGCVLQAGQVLVDVQDGAARISTLVEVVKQYAHLDSAQVQDTDVHAGIDSVLVVLAAELGGVRIVRDYTDASPRIPAYPAELNHVWTNLLDNAADALAGAGTVTIRTVLEERSLRVEIHDDGPGVPEEVIGHVFEPFLSTKGTGAGTGLGLHVAWRIVEQRHRGRIDLTSHSGGTCVTVRLPLHQVLV